MHCIRAVTVVWVWCCATQPFSIARGTPSGAFTVNTAKKGSDGPNPPVSDADDDVLLLLYRFVPGYACRPSNLRCYGLPILGCHIRCSDEESSWAEVYNGGESRDKCQNIDVDCRLQACRRSDVSSSHMLRLSSACADLSAALSTSAPNRLHRC